MSLESSPEPAKGASNSNLRDDSTAAEQDAGMIGQLGDALAGVTLGSSSSNNNAFGFRDERGEPSGNPFNSSNHPPPGKNSGWGGFSNPDTSRNSFARLSTTGNNEGRKDLPSSTSEPPTPDGKQSMELFLSRNPSEVLGSDVFKELSTGNLPGLAISENQDNNFRGAGGQSSGQRRGSPASNVTGTTASNTTGSRSNSPYGSGSTIKAYQGYDQNKNDMSAINSAPVYQPMTPGHSAMINMNPRQQASYNNNSGLNQPYSSPAHEKHTQNSGTPTNNSLHPQQQVLYMAVPTPDGRQVLQPVQMVQMPGKPYAFVLPGSEGMPAMQGGMQSAGQQMMVMPTMVPQQGQLNSPIGRQQQGMHSHQLNDSMGGLIGMNNSGGRNSGHHNKNIVGGGYHGSSNDIGGSGFNNSGSGSLRSDDYSSIQGQGNIDGGDPQYLNQPTDPALASLYSTPQRPPLDALLGQVRRLSRDQVGCRLVQQALDEEGPMAATLILNEGLPFWGEAMVDPFGNYLFQKILEKITAEERIMLVKTVSSRLVNASLNLHGTRSVQKIVELCTIDENSKLSSDKDGGANEETAADVLTKALTPAAARLCIDSHGNHVIQRILLKLGHKHSKFVFDAVAESVGDVARHRHGCCVIQRCLDSPTGPARSNLVCRIVDKSLELMQDAYGNYVVQYVLDVCSDDDVHAVCESVIGKVSLLAIQKFSSNVMEKCLERCSDRVKEHYMQELSDPERVRELMMDPFGNYVVQRALSVSTHTQAVRLVEAMRPHLIAQSPGTPSGQRNGGVRNTAGGRRIMAKICRRFPNFNLNATGTREELYSQNRSRHHHSNHHHQSTPVVPPMYGAMPQLSSPQIPVLQQQHQQPLYTPNPNLTDYNTTPLAINQLNMGGLQFDQRQPYYDPNADASYYQQQQHQQHNNHFGQGAYPSGL